MTHSWPVATLLGSQRPRLESRPAAVGSHGERVLDFCTLAGVTLDDWQAYVVGALFDVQADNTWAATEFGLLVSRQNGKGEILVAYDLAHLFLFPRPDKRRKTILHSAHETKTAFDGFQRLEGVVRSRPRLMSMVKNIYTSNGQEGITLNPRAGQIMGDRIKFIARSKNSGRGFTGDVLVYDEAQEFASSAHEAMTYTQSTVTNRQELFTGTVPGPLNDDEVFGGIRDRGRARSGERTGWMEWSPEGSEDPEAIIDMTNPQVWVDSIPALGTRISAESVGERVERATDVESLGRERFSIWPNRRKETAVKLSELDIERWGLNTTEGAKLGDSPVIAIALGRGGGFATVSAASRFDDDSIVVEHKETRRQTRWVATYVQQLQKDIGAVLIVLDPKNAAVIINDLDVLKVKYLGMNLNEIAAAHSLLIEYSNDGAIVHRGQAEVAASFQFATTRKIGQAGVTWEASDPTKPISHAQSITWAAWGVTKAEANPRKQPAAVRGYA